VVLRSAPHGVLAGQLLPVWPLLWRTFLITLFVSVLLDVTTFWPFSWRGQTSTIWYQVLLDTRQYGGLLSFAVTTSFIIPLIEECVFRFTLLRLIANISGATWVGIVVSSILFGVGHLGRIDFWRADSIHLLNATWLTVFSICLGWIAVFRRNLTVPIAAHVSRNVLELITMLKAIA